MANKKESNEIPEQKKNSSKVKKQPKKAETTEVLDITTFAEYKKLQEELKLTKEAVNESMEMVKSFKQDVDRIKERSQNLKEELTEKITIETVSKLLPVLDNFEKSFDHIVDESDKKGFKMIYNSLVQVVEKMNVEKVEIVANVFDPTKMEAITTEPTDNEDLVGTIATVYQDGYIYKPTDKVIRCTIVSVYNK